MTKVHYREIKRFQRYMENVNHLRGVQSKPFPVMDASVSAYRWQAFSGQIRISTNMNHKKKKKMCQSASKPIWQHNDKHQYQ